MGMGQGYVDFSKSVNAVEAEERGEYPASVCAKMLGIPVEAVRSCTAAETCEHHTSSHYNNTMYYSLRRLRGWLLMEGGWRVVQEIREEERAARRQGGQVYENSAVEWVEWYGTRTRSKAEECRAEGATVTVKGQTATIVFADGKKLMKRLTTRGFSFENQTHRLDRWGEVVEKAAH